MQPKKIGHITVRGLDSSEPAYPIYSKDKDPIQTAISILNDKKFLCFSIDDNRNLHFGTSEEINPSYLYTIYPDYSSASENFMSFIDIFDAALKDQKISVRKFENTNGGYLYNGPVRLQDVTYHLEQKA